MNHSKLLTNNNEKRFLFCFCELVLNKFCFISEKVNVSTVETAVSFQVGVMETNVELTKIVPLVTRI